MTVPVNAPAAGDVRRAKILHIITGLNVGGAETMLAKLLERRARAPHFEQSVLSMMTPGALAPRIEAAGVSVGSLGMTSGAPSLSSYGALKEQVRILDPDLIVGWMHHGFFAAWLASRKNGSPRTPTIWNVRHSLVDISHEKLTTRMVLRFTRRVSGAASAIVYNSYTARKQYADFGFSDAHARVIGNGFDCEAFRPDPQARSRLVETFDLPPDKLIVGLVARHHAMKDPLTMVRAFARVRRAHPGAHLLIVGKGMDEAPEIIDAIEGFDLRDCVTLSGVRLDVAQWLAGLDLVALSSAWGEAFPNILGEAMAAGVPAVSTDVGDAARLLGDPRFIAPPGDDDALADRISRLIGLPPDKRKEIGDAARERIRAAYSIEAIADQYTQLYDAVLTADPAGRTARRQ